VNTEHVVVQGNGDMWCKACGKREPLRLPLGVKDFSIHVQTWMEQHKNCAITDYLTERDRLREAIRHWAVGPHAQWCATRADCPCDCAADEEFEARLTARKLVGLEDEEP